MSKENAVAYIDLMAPDHTRTSCKDGQSYNAAFTLDGTFYNKCERCTLIHIVQLALGEIDPSEEDE